MTSKTEKARAIRKQQLEEERNKRMLKLSRQLVKKEGKTTYDLRKNNEWSWSSINSIIKELKEKNFVKQTEVIEQGRYKVIYSIDPALLPTIETYVAMKSGAELSQGVDWKW